ncbi:zinc-dependent peptidase, M23 peptidase family [Psychroflexus torquis ATCC 700755]|uniref:Zinc-dependent peptidase, M23 peptidase family n=1 Tax=Psychroflexus torquis (strain ATCC 700755 / CIP 106069 / ACAM 623) TaxID=313595 RepID=K4IRL7_PSYTT|nr:peptidoglycan DD-metalloendopeptidase family protein [Psychroflexus torquis]AFU68105.1 zinc-dependent peptidase, M23 peptidase family [Psychroflexus torquis ATCC 700755]
MKIYILFILTFLLVNIAVAQNETTISKTVANEFQEKYNAKDYEGVFTMFAKEMKDFMPHDKALAFLNGLHTEAGNIKERIFMKYHQANVALYKTTFERVVVALFISVDANSKINGLMVKPYVTEKLPELKRNISKLILPFNEEWTVFWGGDTKEQNYHVAYKSQKNAFDMIITNAAGKSHKNDGKNNEDYYAFGKDLIAPASGEVVLVVDGVKDNKPGVTNPNYVPGNTVIIKTSNNEYLFFAHFKQHSIKVKQGQKIQQGDLLGLCGNSGNTTEPHLHFHIQNVEDMNIATGAKAYFEEILVNGELIKEHSPVKFEKVKNK